MPSAFFSVSGAAASPDKAVQADARLFVDELLGETGWHPVIGGILTPWSAGPLGGGRTAAGSRSDRAAKERRREQPPTSRGA